MRLVQAQRQQLTLPMQQALRLLRMSNLELNAEISAELNANPLLEAAHLPSPPIPAPPAGGGAEVAARSESLAEHLLGQLASARFDREQAFLARVLIGEIDADGYLRADLDAIAERLGVELSSFERALSALQGFDPPGVFARDVAECLALQLAARDRLDPLMRGLLDRLDLVESRRFARLAQELGCTREELDEMLAELRRLTPKPGLAFGFEQPVVIIPEVRVSRLPDGGWAVESWSPHLPRLVVRADRYERLASLCRRPEEIRYLKERLSAARRFADLLARRGRTILDVAGEIVRRQEGFLLEGVGGLKPLTLKTVADSLGVHESTVSRAVADKAMRTPRGVLALKAFFAAPASSDEGCVATQGQLTARIGEIIAQDAASGVVLSDETIASRLAAEGIRVSRRTVARRRGGLGVTGAPRRRAPIGAAV